MYQGLYYRLSSNRKAVALKGKETAVFAALFAWRDGLARLEDESTGYIMPNQLLYRISKVSLITPSLFALLISFKRLSSSLSE